jgi:translation initiation factor IF-3
MFLRRACRATLFRLAPPFFSPVARQRPQPHPPATAIFAFQARGLAIRRKGPNHRKKSMADDGEVAAGGGVVKNEDIIRYMRSGEGDDGGREVRVVGAPGDNDRSEIMDLRRALEIGRAEKLDLVLVAPQAQPPTCKLMDLGLANYLRKKKQDEQRKSQAEQRKSEPKVKSKGIRMKLSIADGDFERKMKDGIKFISKGSNVRVSVIVRRPRRGQDPKLVKRQNDAASTTMLKRYVEGLSEVAEIVTKSGGRMVESEGQARSVNLRPIPVDR